MAEIDRQRVLAMYETIGNASEVARQLRLPKSSVLAIIHSAGAIHIHRKKREALTPEEEAQIIEAYRRLHSIYAVSREMKRGDRVVRRILQTAGFDLVRYKRGPKPAPGTKLTKSVQRRAVPHYVGCALPRRRIGVGKSAMVFCSVCKEALPSDCPGTCTVGKLGADTDCPRMAECPCAQEATAERRKAFEEWRDKQ